MSNLSDAPSLFLKNLYQYYLKGYLKAGNSIFISYYASTPVGTNGDYVYYLSRNPQNKYFWNPVLTNLTDYLAIFNVVSIDNEKLEIVLQDTTMGGNYLGYDGDGNFISSSSPQKISLQVHPNFNVSNKAVFYGIKYIPSKNDGSKKVLSSMFYQGYTTSSDSPHFANTVDFSRLLPMDHPVPSSDGIWMIPCLFYYQEGTTCHPTCDPNHISCQGGSGGGSIGLEVGWIQSNGQTVYRGYMSEVQCKAGYFYTYCPPGKNCGDQVEGSTGPGCFSICNNLSQECLYSNGLLPGEKEKMSCQDSVKKPWYLTPWMIVLIIGIAFFTILFFSFIIYLLTR